MVDSTIEPTINNIGTKREVRKKVFESRAELWQAQKDATQNIIEWLEKMSKTELGQRRKLIGKIR